MGNNLSAANVHQQSGPNGAGDVTRGLSNSHERDQKGESRNPSAARYVATQSPPQQRIVVDIRSANLDKDYNVYIRQEPRRELDVELRSIWNGVQAIGGVLITFLTIQKLWEDIRFIRLLRGELSTLVGSLTDAGSGPEAGLGDDAGIRALRPRNGGRRSPSRRSLDLSLDQLSDLLGGARGQAHQTAAAATEQAGPDAASREQQPQEAGDDGSQTGPKAITWASISGLTEVKILLQEATVLPTLRPDLFQGIRQPPKALLLFGPPGTGKTLLARSVAAESRATFLPVTGSSVLSMWYGQSEQNVKALFEKARRRQPAIIFIDEVDSLLGKRSSGGLHDSSSTPDKRVTNEFLAFIDGIQTQQAGSGSNSSGGGGAGDTRITIIAATNTPWDLDEAALSRFSRRIYVPLPDKATREALMRKAMEGVTCDISKEEWQRLAERCDKYSGRDLVQVCREAAMRPLRELWGQRLLEGGTCPGATCSPAPHHAAAQKRLVELVADSLVAAVAANGEARRAKGGAAAGVGEVTAEAGSAAAAAAGSKRRRWGGRWRWGGLGFDRYTWSKKQARRELEKWKRQHGANWCDVEAVMAQAESLADSRRRQGVRAAAAAEAGAEGAPVNGNTGDDQQQQQSAEAEPQHATQDTDAAPGQQTQGEGTGAVLAGDTVLQPAGPAQVLQGDNGITAGALGGGGGPPLHTPVAPLGTASALPTAITPSCSTTASGSAVVPAPADSGTLQEVDPSCSVAPSAAAGSDASSLAGGAVAPDLVVAGAQSSDAAQTLTAPTGPDVAQKTSAALDARSTPSGAPSVPPADGGSGSSARSAVTTTPSAACSGSGDGTCSAATDHPSRAAAATAATATTGGTARAGSGSALSLADLLTLPASRVRPVLAADLEAALQVISCTEMDQSARYTEWDEQYGSGANPKGCHGGGRGSRWISMYS